MKTVVLKDLPFQFPPPSDGWTERPYWMVIEANRAKLAEGESITADDIRKTLTGPFFSQESAEAYVEALSYRLWDPEIWCLGGGESPDYRALYLAKERAEAGTPPDTVEGDAS